MNEQRLNRSPLPQDPFDSRMKRKREFLIERNASPLSLSLFTSRKRIIVIPCYMNRIYPHPLNHGENSKTRFSSKGGSKARSRREGKKKRERKNEREGGERKVKEVRRKADAARNSGDDR